MLQTIGGVIGGGRDTEQVSRDQSFGVKRVLAYCTVFTVQYSETVLPKAGFQGQPQDTQLQYFCHVLIWFAVS